MKPVTRWTLVSALLMPAVVLSYEGRGGFDNSMWDLDAYSRAVHDYARGVNPYRTDTSDVFVYHPLVLSSFHAVDAALHPLLGSLIDCPLRTLLLLLYVLAAACFLWQLVRFAREPTCGVVVRHPSAWILVPVVIGAVGYGKAGATSYLSGNLTPALHLAMIAVLLKLLRSSDRRYLAVFVASVVAASLIKPYMLTYLLVCAVVGTPRQAMAYVGIAVASFATGWLSTQYVLPDAYEAFLVALEHQTFGTDDLGYSMVGLTYGYLTYTGALLAHVLFIAAAAWFCLVALPQRLHIGVRSAGGVLLLAAWTLLVNPRLKEYDVFPLILCVFAFVCVYVPRHVMKIVCVGVLTAGIGVAGEQFQRAGHAIPAVLADTHAFEIAGLILIAASIWLCAPRNVAHVTAGGIA